MNLIDDLLNDRIITALGWNIFHLLWQGIIVAVILSLVLRLLKARSAQLRYAVSLISLFLMIGLSIFNFTNNFESKTTTLDHQDEIAKTKNNQLFVLELKANPVKETTSEIITNFKEKVNRIDKYFPMMVNLWMLGVFIFTVKFILSYVYTVRLKTHQIKEVTPHWIERLIRVEHLLKINKAVKYIESSLVKVPLVIGYLKPVVIIPTEMLTGMPANQIEAIIAHEIAHIRRNDYIFNVLQTMIETILFFHPGVWYISSQIRKERENSCDDLAITACEGSIVFAKALVSVQELSLNKYYSAVAFSGKKKHLLNRIKRMIMKPKVKSNFADKIIAAMIIISGVLALSFTTSNENEYLPDIEMFKETKEQISDIKTLKTEIKEVKKHITPVPVIMDTVHIYNDYHDDHFEIEDNTVIRTYKRNGKKQKMKFTLKNGKATDLYVDGKKIPEKDYDQYQDEIDETMDDLKEAKHDIRDAMKDIEDLDLEEIHREIEQAMKDVHVNMEEVQKEIARAMEDIETVDIEEIMENVEMHISDLEEMDFDFDEDIHFHIEDFDYDIDLDEVREELERAREEIKMNVDVAAIQKEMMKVQEELSKIDHEEILRQAQEDLKDFEAPNKEEIRKDLEKTLEELEKLELEEK